MYIREAKEQDITGLLKLYQQFGKGAALKPDKNVIHVWNKIMRDKDHHIIVGIEDDIIVSSCTINIIPNLNHEARPYALIENVITDEKYRNRGYASQLLDYAKEIAINNNCYKIMLMTGSKLESTLNFYERAGYNRTDKTAFIQWI